MTKHSWNNETGYMTTLLIAVRERLMGALTCVDRLITIAASQVQIPDFLTQPLGSEVPEGYMITDTNATGQRIQRIEFCHQRKHPSESAAA